MTRLGVVGAGLMGSEIAYVAAQAGVEVVLRDLDATLVEKGIDHAREIAERRVARGRLSREDADALLGRIVAAKSDADLAGCDVVIEAVSEVMDVKRAVFRGLDAVTPPGTVLASNTSGLSISEIARTTSRPDRVLGLHFFNPASTMKLVEVIRGEATSDETAELGMDLARQLGKTPVAVGECPGFLVNRVLARALFEAYRHAADVGADHAAVDAAVADGGPAPMGPFALGDLIGLDTLAHVQRDLEAAYGERYQDGLTLAPLVAAGRLGQKIGGGFFSGAVDAPVVTPAALGVSDRYYFGALDEARRCLEEGIATAPDIDTAMCLGTGWSEGPLAWAEGLGENVVRARMTELAATAGPRFIVR